MKLLKDLGSLYPTEKSKHKCRYGLYECPICFKPFKTMTPSVKRGKTTKCKSCSISIKNTTHGLRYKKGYERWNSMVSRCLNKNNNSYQNYGGRGITVCDEWMNNPQLYLEHITKLPNSFVNGFTLDRIRNNDNYVPGNLRWVKWEIQNTNQRKKKISKFKYIGVYQLDKTSLFGFRIRCNGKRIYRGSFKTQEDAAKARDEFIKSNNLPHILTGVA